MTSTHQKVTWRNKRTRELSLYMKSWINGDIGLARIYRIGCSTNVSDDEDHVPYDAQDKSIDQFNISWWYIKTSDDFPYQASTMVTFDETPQLRYTFSKPTGDVSYKTQPGFDIKIHGGWLPRMEVQISFLHNFILNNDAACFRIQCLMIDRKLRLFGHQGLRERHLLWCVPGDYLIPG